MGARAIKAREDDAMGTPMARRKAVRWPTTRGSFGHCSTIRSTGTQHSRRADKRGGGLTMPWATRTKVYRYENASGTRWAEVSWSRKRKPRQRWCLQWRVPGMPAQAFEYYDTPDKAHGHAQRITSRSAG
jgi:hypothetical protein